MFSLQKLLAFFLILLTVSADKLRIGITKKVENCARKTKVGDTIKVHYTGSLKADGKVFDSSLRNGVPFEFTLGSGMVIKGWDQGLTGMCVGEQRKLTIPPELGYGARGAGGVIPPQATLVFTTELVAIEGYEEEKEEHDEL